MLVNAHVIEALEAKVAALESDLTAANDRAERWEAEAMHQRERLSAIGRALGMTPTYLFDELAPAVARLKARAVDGWTHPEEVAADRARLVGERDGLRAALVSAEAALADIGDAQREPGDDMAWCERRAAEALPTVREAIAASGGGGAG